jgi:hypothetical protein
MGKASSNPSLGGRSMKSLKGSVPDDIPPVTLIIEVFL